MEIPTSESLSDDRPTTPPPFDIEAFARQSIAMDSELPATVAPIAQRPPQDVPGADLEGILGQASSPVGAPSMWASTTTRPVTFSTGPTRPSLSVGVRRTTVALAGIAVLSLIVLDGARVIGAGRTRAAARVTSDTVQAVPPAPSAPVVALPPDLPVVLTVVRIAAPPSAVRAFPPRVAPPAPVAGASTGCKPPYVIDAETGKKHWKLQCL